VALVHGKGQDEVLADRVLSLALVRLLEIIGEAGHRGSPGVRPDTAGGTRRSTSQKGAAQRRHERPIRLLAMAMRWDL
jgi:hypothetical protein